ncbi:proline-rich protein 2-like [Panicum virgatum]|uniref:proline-rich protein 2-like n=1 Tax=Panicum virgatum TaxID=38727 RepID=UPI0019D55CA5|nr:proline-rich protein 2-like [Panicum virgatum]
MALPEPSSTRCSTLAPPPGPNSRSPLPLRLAAAGLECSPPRDVALRGGLAFTPPRPLRLGAELRGARQGGRGEGAGEGKDGAAPWVAGVGNRGGAVLHGRSRTSPKQGPPAHRRRRPRGGPAGRHRATSPRPRPLRAEAPPAGTAPRPRPLRALAPPAGTAPRPRPLRALAPPAPCRGPAGRRAPRPRRLPGEEAPLRALAHAAGPASRLGSALAGLK